MKLLVALTSGLVLAGSLGVVALFASSAPSFATARNYPTGRAPFSVVIGDLNGDGKPDLATANALSNSVSVRFNRGDGSFQAKLDYVTGSFPTLAIGDVNGNGSPDLATANVDANTVSVLLNRGDGSFQAKTDYATGRVPEAVAIDDLNGDGKPDLATANVDANTVSVLLNRGDGSFQANLEYATGRGPYSIAIGDLNGDGKPDLATANEGADTVSVLTNGGDGSFRAKRDYRTGSGPFSVAIGDLNGDLKPDLATANFDANTVSVILNRADGSFQAKLDYRTGRIPWSVAIGDVDGDGKPDLATANREIAGEGGSNTVAVLLNKGDGSFQAKLEYATGRSPVSVAIGDLNADGKPDLATANEVANTVSVLLNTPGLCSVQDVKRQKLAAAKRTIMRANCRVGKILRASSNTVKRGRVISEKPKPGTVLPGDGRVTLVVSSGRRR
ncbi:MAG TPA: FG-GAP-like repeat-containing protein [Gaiellaceae bacterium]|nr:FG-GAP-like repeat-containing protein [Gaiellaceae bacterium]